MNLTSLIIIIAVVVAVYFFVKFIVSPLMKLVAGILILLIAIYVLQKYFGFNVIQFPYGKYLDINSWVDIFTSVFTTGLKYINQFLDMLKTVISGMPKVK